MSAAKRNGVGVVTWVKSYRDQTFLLSHETHIIIRCLTRPQVIGAILNLMNNRKQISRLILSPAEMGPMIDFVQHKASADKPELRWKNRVSTANFSSMMRKSIIKQTYLKEYWIGLFKQFNSGSIIRNKAFCA